RDDFRLAFHTRCAKAYALRTVVVERCTFNDRINRVAVLDRVLQSLQYDYADTIAKYSAGSLSVKRAGVSVRRSNVSLVIVIAGLLRLPDRDTAGQGHVALVCHQRLT